MDEVFAVDNLGGFSTTAFYIVPPTGGEVAIEATFDTGASWVGISLRGVNSDIMTQSITETGNYMGSIAGASALRFRTSSAGSGDGSISGRIEKAISVIETIEFGYAPHKIGYQTVHRDVSFNTAQTGTTIWQPATGHRFILTDLIVICGGVTNATVTIFDETDTVGNRVFKGDIDVANNRQFRMNHAFKVPYSSNATGNILKLTTDANITIDVTAHGYEVGN